VEACCGGLAQGQAGLEDGLQWHRISGIWRGWLGVRERFGCIRQWRLKRWQHAHLYMTDRIAVTAR
jgi:hypothetical protein